MASANPFNGRTLYRYFDTTEHADALAQGYVWISTLQTCRRYENKHQGDPVEGLAYYNSGTVTERDPEFVEIARMSGFGIPPTARRVRIKDNMTIDPRSLVNDAFVLCTSARFDPVAFAAAWDAQFCTEITDAGRFFRLVTERLIELFGRARVQDAMGAVIYRDRGYSNPIGFVKPSRYAAQDEQRMLWAVAGPEPYKPFLLYAPAVAPLCRRRAP